MDRLESYNDLPEMNALNDMKQQRKRKKRRVKRNQFDTAEGRQYGDDDDGYYEP